MPTNLELAQEVERLKKLLMEHEHQPINSSMNFVTRLVRKAGGIFEPLEVDKPVDVKS